MSGVFGSKKDISGQSTDKVGQSTDKMGQSTDRSEYKRQLRLHKKQLDLKKLEILENAGEKTLDIVRELVRTVHTNPVMGGVLGIVTLNVLYRMRIIDSVAYGLGLALILGAEVLGAIGGEIGLEGISFSFGNKINDFAPSVKTLVFAEGGSDSLNSKVSALLSRLGEDK